MDVDNEYEAERAEQLQEIAEGNAEIEAKLKPTPDVGGARCKCPASSGISMESDSR